MWLTWMCWSRGLMPSDLMTLWASMRDDVHEPADARSLSARISPAFRFPGMPVEVMGGLELHGDDGWQLVRAGRLPLVGLNGLAVPVPSMADQIRMLESFGREKDLRRAAALRTLAATNSLPPVLSSSISSSH